MGGKARGLVWMLLGLALLLSAAGLAVYNSLEAKQAERASVQVLPELEAMIPTREEEAGELPLAMSIPLDVNPLPLGEMPEKTVGNLPYIGVLSVPALELELPVISQWSYPRLKIAPCRYEGSAYTGDLILCGHNYPTHFGKLSTLRQGDEVTLTDMDGNLFRYCLVETETLNPTAVEELLAGDWDLTLFTCTLGGKTRVTLRFTLEEFIPQPTE